MKKIAEEIWKDIEGYEGLYKVSTCGKIYSCRKNKILKTFLNDDGYYRLNLYKNKSIKLFYVARLVATAFIPNHKLKETVDHIDGNTQNNHVSNLRWATYKEQTKYRNQNGNTPIIPNHRRKIKQIDPKTNEVVATYNSIKKASEKTGASISCISSCLKYKNRKVAGGFNWENGEKLEIRKKIFQIDLKTNKIIKVFNSLYQAVKETKINRGNIILCVRNKRNSAGGYKWKLLEE